MPTTTDHRHAIVTGASEGIGRAFALALVEQGWIVTAVARNAERLAALVAETSGTGPGKIIALAADLSSSAGINACKAACSARPTALLVNNAGAGLYGPYHHLDWDKLQSMMQLNINALAELSHAYLQQADAGDALINVSSVLSFLPSPSHALYAASKAFVTSLTEALWYEGRERGVYVMNLCPGATRSAFHGRAGGLASRQAPAFMTQTPEAVVEKALAALQLRRRPTVISGWPNLVMELLARLLGRRGTVQLMGLSGGS